MGTTMGVKNGDTRSLDSGSCNLNGLHIALSKTILRAAAYV